MSKIKTTWNTPADGNTKDIEVAVPLKNLSNFWRNPVMSLVNCEINLILTWSSTCTPTNSTGAGTFVITDTKLYFPVITLWTQYNAKLLQQLKSDSKRTINWNKHQSKVLPERPNQYLDCLIDPHFQGVNRLFVLSFENSADRTDWHKKLFW